MDALNKSSDKQAPWIGFGAQNNLQISRNLI